MFEEDEQGDLLIAPECIRPGAKVVSGEAAAKLLASDVAETLSLIEPPAAPETTGVKTLREMLYDQEPWRIYGGGDAHLSPGVRRLLERRINILLDTVANWMLAVVEESRDDEMTLVVLLELAEKIRQEITWPERDAQAALALLTTQTQELEQ
jgi:hypothetical protein